MEPVPVARQGGAGNASDRPVLTALAPFFASWHDAVAFLSLQHGAIAQVEDCGRLAHAGIDLPIDIDAVEPLQPVEPAIGGAFLKRIGAVGTPFRFVVPAVKFRVLSERLL